MRYPRREFGDVSMEAAPGLFADDEAPPGAIAALAAAAPASLRIHKRPATKERSVAAYLDEEAPAGEKISVIACGERHSWPGLAVLEEGDPRRAHFAFESDGYFYHGVVEIATELWDDYFPFFEHAMLTFDTGGEPRPTLPLRNDERPPAITPAPGRVDDDADLSRRVKDAAAGAQAAIFALEFEAAERAVLSIDSDIRGAAMLAAAYETALAERPESAEIFERALYWARRAVPEPHTEIEAENFGAAVKESEARLFSLRKCAGAD